MRNVRNAAVAGAGIFVGDMVASVVVGALPRAADGSINPMLERVVRYGISGLVVVIALKQFGAKKA